jgi:hypothetical protein
MACLLSQYCKDGECHEIEKSHLGLELECVFGETER